MAYLNMNKIILIIALVIIYNKNTRSEDKVPSIKQICNIVQYEVRELELQKQNLKKEFKKIKSDLKQFELLPEFTKDVNRTIKQQIQQAKLYHYLECSKFKK